MGQIERICSLVTLASFACFAFAQGNLQYFMANITPPICNCPPVNASSALATATIPAGRTFTDNCVNGECETIKAGEHVVQKNIPIPVGECLDWVMVRVTYTGAIFVECGPEECPNGVSVAAERHEWFWDSSPCLEEGDPEDPGVEA